MKELPSRRLLRNPAKPRDFPDNVPRCRRLQRYLPKEVLKKLSLSDS
jgi:hypothetical protein